MTAHTPPKHIQKPTRIHTEAPFVVSQISAAASTATRSEQAAYHKEKNTWTDDVVRWAGRKQIEI